MKVLLTHKTIAEEETEFNLCFHPSSEAYGPHISSGDKLGFHIRMTYSREEIMLMRDWCDGILRRQS